MYLGAVEHLWGDDAKPHYELNHLFEVSLPALAEGETPSSREAHLDFFWAEVAALAENQLEPAPLRHFLKNPLPKPSALWASTLANGA